MLMFLSLIETEEERALCERLYYDNRAAMFAIAKTYLRNDQDAEDVVHTVFCELADRSIGKLVSRTDEECRRFLFVATKYRAINLIKKNSRVVSLDAAGMEAGNGALEYTDEAFIERLYAKALYQKVVDAIKRMMPEEGELLWMRFGLELETAEIAGTLNEKPATITKRLQRAKKKLVSLLDAEGGAA